MKTLDTLLKNKSLSIICGIMILVLCSIPSHELPQNLGFSDKAEHFIAFGVWSFLTIYSFRNTFFTFIAGILFGIGIEFWQSILPESFHRSFDWYDAVADTIGVILGIIVFLAIHKAKLVAKE